MFEEFINVYPVTKTLRFELKPIGKTEEYIKQSGVLDRDFNRNSMYDNTKDLLDAQHKALLERALSTCDEIDWQPLADAYVEFRNGDNSQAARKTLEKVNSEYRKKIVAHLKMDEMYKDLTASTPSDFFKVMKNQAKEKNIPLNEGVETFASFACYFKGYQENRKNIYSDEKQVTAAANRAINENFLRYLECCNIFKHLLEKYPIVVSDAQKELKEVLLGQNLADVFTVKNYSRVLAQSGIERFNVLLGGKTKESQQKIKGLNEFINLYR